MSKTRSGQILSTLVLALTISILGSGCKSKEKLTTKELSYKSSDVLFEKLSENELDYEWLSARVSVDLKSGKSGNSFNARLRMRKDSAIWVSITPALGIEAARVLITPDSLKFIDRINNQYFIGGYEMVNEMLETDIDFEMLEAVITGNSFKLYANDKFEASIGKQHYIISTIRRRHLKKEFKDVDSVRVILQNIWLNPETYKIDRMTLKDIQSNKKVDALYSDFEDIGEQSIPTKLEVNIKAEENALVLLDYSRIELDEEQNFPMRIPSKYKPIEFQKTEK